MKKLTALSLLSIGLLTGNAYATHNYPSWDTWAPKVAVQQNDLDQFRSSLPQQAQQAWDQASGATQRIAYMLMLGMKQANNNQVNGDGYYQAFKIANKAEAGFHLDKAVRTIDIGVSH